ncbi:MAG TPA: flagellar filament capping protein FliD [Candidatus Solibacter sp.]|nr:flagellar filament capping protein FliD [Candidatus Solibacter sp.]
MGVSLNPASILSGQGIDVSSVVQQIITAQSGPLTVWQNQQATLQSQAIALTAINNDLGHLATAVQALSDPVGVFVNQTATSSQPAILTATAQISATPGSHNIIVNNLATTGALYTEGIPNATASILDGAGSGDIQLQVGGATGTTHDIHITAGTNDTLNTLASYINTQSNANNWGVTASVVTDASGARLAIYSQATGTTGAVSLSSSTLPNNTTTLTFDAPVGGANASFSIDGVPFSSASNTVNGAIPGVTLNLLSSAPGTPVQLTVGVDQSQITSAVNDFISAYNTVINDINTQYTVNPVTNNEGPAGGDASLRTLQSTLLADAAYSLPLNSNSGYVNLESLGINTNNDGTLTLGKNAAGQTLSDVLAANPAAVQSFFQNASSTGFANNLNSDLTGLTDPTTGPLNVDLAQNQTTLQNLATNITNFQTQLTAEQTQLTSQYDAVNASLQSYPLLLQQITQVLGSLGTSTSSTGTSPTNPILTSGL